MNKPHAFTVSHCYVCGKCSLVRAACCWGWLNCREPPASSSAPPSPTAAASPTAPPPAAAAFPFDSLPCPAFDPDYFTAAGEYRRPEEGTPGTPARANYQYWTGAPQPWRNGSGEPVHDAGAIAAEAQHKAAAEHEDGQFSAEELADNLHGLGIRVDFLLAFTFSFNLWEWTTLEVNNNTNTKLHARAQH